MRVLHVVPSLAARRGGPSTVIASLVPALVARGVEVDIVATTAGSSPGERASLTAALAPARVSFADVIGSERVELSVGIVPLIARRVRACDVVHLHTVFTFPLVAAAACARLADVPYIVRPAGTLDEVCLRSRSYAAKRIALATWVDAMLRGAAAVQATSALERAELTQLVDPAKVVEVELGADPVDVPPDRGDRGTRVLTIGRLHPLKGLERLIDAIAALDRAALVIAGAGDPAYVATLPSHRRVERVGHVDRVAKRRLLADTDLCVFPSTHESFGVAVVEAMAAGRAVIVTDRVGVAPAIAEAGAGIVLRDGESLAAAIAELLADDTKRAAMAEAGRALARTRYAWSAAADRTIELYDEVLRRPRRRSIGVTGRASSLR